MEDEPDGDAGVHRRLILGHGDGAVELKRLGSGVSVHYLHRHIHVCVHTWKNINIGNWESSLFATNQNRKFFDVEN